MDGTWGRNLKSLWYRTMLSKEKSHSCLSAVVDLTSKICSSLFLLFSSFFRQNNSLPSLTIGKISAWIEWCSPRAEQGRLSYSPGIQRLRQGSKTAPFRVRKLPAHSEPKVLCLLQPSEPSGWEER